MDRPRDGIFTKFNDVVMDEICALVPNFTNREEAHVWYLKFRNSAAFKRRAERHNNRFIQHDIDYRPRPYVCTDQADNKWSGNHPYIELGPHRHNKMEVLHILAHVLQPAEGPWHGGDFGKTFLDLVNLAFNPAMKKLVKEILMKHKVKTTAYKLSDEAREKAANKALANFHAVDPDDLEAGLREMLADLRGDDTFRLEK